MKVPDRMAFMSELEAALSAPTPSRNVNELLRAVLKAEPDEWELDEQRLVRMISERVDVANGDETGLLQLARNMYALLKGASSNEVVEQLLELIADRERVLVIIHKYVEGAITRVSFLSFVAQQRWPNDLRRRVAALSTTTIELLATALESTDISQLEVLLES